jgi:uncharacterized membrane protein YhaH (DUF805 family)
MSPGEAIRSVLHKYAVFSGRASRSEYWWWVLAYFVAYIAVVIVSVATRSGVLIALIGLAALVLLIPSVAVWVRRLHDVGRSGWWWLIALIPLGAFVLLIFTILDSQNGPNRWGPPPYGSRYFNGSYDAATQGGWGAPPPQATSPGWGAPPQQPSWSPPPAQPQQPSWVPPQPAAPQGPPPGWGGPPQQPPAPPQAPPPGWSVPQQPQQAWAPPPQQSPQAWAPPPQAPAPPPVQPPQGWGPPPQGPGPNDPQAR